MSDLLNTQGGFSPLSPLEQLNQEGVYLLKEEPPFAKAGDRNPIDPHGSITLASQAIAVQHALDGWSGDGERVRHLRDKAHGVAQLALLMTPATRIDPDALRASIDDADIDSIVDVDEPDHLEADYSGARRAGLAGLPANGRGSEILTVFTPDEQGIIRAALRAAAWRRAPEAGAPELFTHSAEHDEAASYFEAEARLILARAFPGRNIVPGRSIVDYLRAMKSTTWRMSAALGTVTIALSARHHRRESVVAASRQ